MRLRNKLFLAFGLFTLILIILGLVNLYLLGNIERAIENATGRLNLVNKKTQQGKTLILNIHGDILNALVLSPQEKDTLYKLLDTHARIFYKNMDDIRATNFAKETTIDSIYREFQKFYLFSRAVVEKYDLNTIKAQPDVLFKLKQMKDDLLIRMIVFSRAVNKEFDQSLLEIRHQEELARRTLFPIILIAIVFSVVFTLIITKSLTSPIRSIVDNIREIEKGNYKV